MRRTKFKLAAGLAVLATAGGGALQLAAGSQADRPPEPKPRKAPAANASAAKALSASTGLANASNFDPIVQDALDGVDDVGQLVDDTLAELDEQPAPSIGGVTPGDISGGGITDDVLGFINGGMGRITPVIGDVVEGKELTQEQREICDFLIRKGPSIDAWGDIMKVSDQIDIDLANDHLKQLYPDGFTDAAGVTWKPDHHAGGWIKVRENAITGTPVYTPTPSIPPYSPGHSSGSPWNDEPKPSLLELFD